MFLYLSIVLQEDSFFFLNSIVRLSIILDRKCFKRNALLRIRKRKMKRSEMDCMAKRLGGNSARNKHRSVAYDGRADASLMDP